MLNSTNHHFKPPRKLINFTEFSFTPINTPRAVGATLPSPSGKDSNNILLSPKRLYTSPQAENLSPIAQGRTRSMDFKSFFPLLPIPNISQDRSPSSNEGIMGVSPSSPGREKSIPKPVTPMTTQITHSKEFHSPQRFMVKGLEIPNTPLIQAEQGAGNPRSHKKVKTLSISTIDNMFRQQAMQVYTPKTATKNNKKDNKKDNKMEKHKGSPTYSYTHRPMTVLGMGVAQDPKSVQKLLGIDKLYSSRQSIKLILAEEAYRSKLEDMPFPSGDIDNKMRFEYNVFGSRRSPREKFQKPERDLQALQCFLDTKTVWKRSLGKRPSYSLYQNISNNRKATKSNKDTVETIKEVCKPLPIKLQKAMGN